MTEHTQLTETDGDVGRDRGPIGTFVGASLGPFGAAVGTVVDDTRFLLKLSVGGGASDGAEGTTIEIEDAAEYSGDRTEGDGTARSIDDATDERAGEPSGAAEGPGPDR